MTWEDELVVPFREPLAPGTLMQRGLYRLGEVVGEGSFSITYAARQRPGKLAVAIKEFFPQGCWREDFKIMPGAPYTPEEFGRGVQAFLQEGTFLERFNHPGIVRLLGMFQAHGTAYLVEELLSGVTLGEGLRSAGAMPVERVMEAVRQVGEALIEVHEKGLLHTDLKPDNLFITGEGRYVILDFGTARTYGEHAPWTGVAAVSPGYSPLEQYQKDQRLTPAADVYALAATVYHLLQGYPPPDSRERSRGAHLIPLANSTATIERALSEALQLHPLRRTPSIGQFLDQLGSPRHGYPIPTAWIEPFQLRAERTAHLGATSMLVLDSPHQLVYSGGRDGRLCGHTWPELKPHISQQAHRGPVSALAVSPDGRYLASGGLDGSIKLWSTTERADCHWLVASGPAVRALRFHPSQDFLVAALADGSCRLLSANLSRDFTFLCQQGSLHALEVHPAGKVLATGGEKGRVHLWELESGSLNGSLAVAGLVRALRFNHDGSGLLVSSGNSSVGLWDVESRREVRSFFGHRSEIWDACFSCDQTMIITTSADHSLYGYRADSGRLLMCTEVNQGLTGTICADPEQRLLGAGGGDGHLRVFAY
ncbi:MAG: serine/threonine protein kinase [Candidatus Eremiobacteraeota bacterium]|nr:serine/threonine protein kinase [Candidatus Eremiobacteraeota bacterium]MCW5866674.1 serine/threonine protein kinase [Candidatus Eremiobacteraeota bacterium]